MSVHEQSIGKTDEWYTPPYVFKAMGVTFDLDVAHPGVRALDWVPARRVIEHGSLEQRWAGFVWMNPPFGGRGGLAPWLEKFFAHGNGVALTPDRTSAPWWHQYAPRADAILFVGRPNPPRGQSNKIQFIGQNGKPGKSPAQGTTLMAAGPMGCEALSRAARAGLGLLLVNPVKPPTVQVGASA